jgi:raffinose/stachyose/melibiose transport system substrate-binding protein
MAMKHITGVAGAVVAALILAGCSSGANTTDASGKPTGDITVLTNRTDLVDTVFADYKSKFEKKYPDVKVTFEAITDYESEVTTRLGTKDYGDVLGIPASVTKDQLTDFFEPLGKLADMQKDYRFVAEQAFDGTVYGLPTFGGANGFVYNKKVWADAGVTTNPTTPEEFITDLKAIKAKGAAIPLYTNYKDGWPLGQWQGFRGTSGDKEIVQTMDKSDAPWSAGSDQYLIDSLIYNVVSNKLTEPDPLTTSWEGSKGLLATGKVGTMALGSWAIVQFQKAATDAGADPADIGYMPFPNQVDGKFHSVIAGDFKNAININSTHKAAARAWIDWFTNDSGFADSQGAISPKVGSENPATLADFTKADVQYLELTPAPTDQATLDSDIYNGANIDLFGQVYRQKLVDTARGAANGDMKSYFADLNQRWAAAKAKAGK